MSQDRAQQANTVQHLTPRESEVAVLLGEGWGSGEIADRLSLASSSVKWSRRQIYALAFAAQAGPAMQLRVYWISDMRFTVEEQVAEGDLVACRVTMHAVRSGGEFQGIAPSGIPITTEP